MEKIGKRVHMIELDQLVPRKGNRKVGGMPKESLEELADSIKAKGILQPLIIRKKKNGEGLDLYEIVAGERRCRASGMAGLKTVPCRICGCTQENPCPEGCAWTDKTRTLCTACANKKGKRRGK